MTRPGSRPVTHPTLALLLAPALLLAATAAAHAMPPAPFQGERGARPSAALERMWRDWLDAGKPLDPEIVRRWRLDEPLDRAFTHEHPDAALGRSVFGVNAALDLAGDVQINDTAGDASCSACSFRPLVQSETTIAANEGNLVAGWNDSKGFCSGAVQGYGYSTDDGATWVDAGEVPALAGGGRYRGDPVHDVNRKTNDFYICGLYEGGAMGSGLALLRASFPGGVFTIEDNRQIAVGGASFLDKEWMVADSLTGNLYVSYTNFAPGGGRIDFIRSTDNGLTWSAPMTLNQPVTYGSVQGSRPVVGPDGELYVVWTEFDYPENYLRIRRSDDFGVSFGSEQTIVAFIENGWSGAPGYRRNFTLALPGIAVDRSTGPHRGRVYATWVESVNYYDTIFSTLSPISEVENNSNFANATPFTVGDVLRGNASFQGDLDIFRFSGLQGQTVILSADSTASGIQLATRLVCSADTSNFNNYRFLAYTLSNLPTLVFTLPADGEYYLHVTSNNAMTGPYRILTEWDSPTLGDRAGDHRDVFLAHSDDGASWSTPVQLNDDDPWHDQIFPEVVVDDVGGVHAYWHDWRDDPVCGAESQEYVVSSGDGGVSWGGNRRASDASSFWSFNACGSANQGDYQGIAAQGNTVYLCWADSRNGDPDVFLDRALYDFTITPCVPAVSDTGGASTVLEFTVENTGNTETPYDWEVLESNGWLAGVVPSASGSVSLLPSGTQVVSVTLDLPSDCTPGVDTLRMIVSDPSIPGRTDTCMTLVTCESVVGVPEGGTPRLALLPPSPNPATGDVQLRFTLPASGFASLRIYSAAGALVRTLYAGEAPAGPSQVSWDGRDERGRLAAAGTYFVRLQAGDGTRHRTVTLLR